jgi:hypothetical protein
VHELVIVFSHFYYILFNIQNAQKLSYSSSKKKIAGCEVGEGKRVGYGGENGKGREGAEGRGGEGKETRRGEEGKGIGIENMSPSFENVDTLLYITDISIKSVACCA